MPTIVFVSFINCFILFFLLFLDLFLFELCKINNPDYDEDWFV